MKKFYREDVKEIFKKSVAPQLKEFEQERRIWVSKLTIIELILFSIIVTLGFSSGINLFFIDILVAIIVASLWFQLEKTSLIIGPGLIFIFLLIAPNTFRLNYSVNDIVITALSYIIFLLPFWSNKSFQKRMKKQCMPFIISCYHNMQWVHNSNLLYEKALVRSQLFESFKKIETDDTFTGNYNGVDFYISESTFDNDNILDKNFKNFKGVIITFNSNKTIKTPTVIVSKPEKHINIVEALIHGGIFFAVCILPLYYVFLNGGIIVNQNNFSILTMLAILTEAFFVWYFIKCRQSKIKMESDDWNNRFKIIKGDEIDSRYLLTTGFVDRFNRLMTAFGTKDIKCSFFEDKIMFAISTNKNLFEMGNLFSDVTDPLYMVQFFSEISSILNMIDYFKLDEKTGL